MQTRMKVNAVIKILLFDLSESYGINKKLGPILDQRENDLEIDELS